MLTKVCNPQTKGPSATLRTVLQKLGNINGEGHLLTEQFGRVDWTTCSKKFLKFVITEQWNLYVCKQLQHREYFTAKQTDGIALQKFCKNLCAPDFYCLSVHLTGAHCTQDLKCKFLEEANICPLCQNSPDSRFHRTLECSTLDDLRTTWTEHTWTVAREDLTAHFGLLDLPDDLARARLLIPIRSMFPDASPPLLDMTQLLVFVDGTCFHPQSPLTALAAGAAIVVSANPERKVLKVQRALLPTRDRNSHRAEIYALMIGLSFGTSLQIYSDCQSVIDMFQDLATAINNQTRLPDLDNWDLWSREHELIQFRTTHINLIKTKGHDTMNGHTPKHWQAWANTEVDKQAKAAVTQDNPDLLFRFNRIVYLLGKRHEAHEQILKLHVAAANWVFRSKTNISVPPKQNGDRPTEVVQRNFPEIPDEVTNCCPINMDFLQRLVFCGVELCSGNPTQPVKPPI